MAKTIKTYSMYAVAIFINNNYAVPLLKLLMLSLRFVALRFGALHPPTDKRKLNPEREVEERQIPVWNNKPDSKPLVNSQQQI